MGWLVALAATAVYVLTADRSVSWWDCGEFITVSNGLYVGHPPGAPLYQLVAHLFCLMAPNPGQIAFCCNLLSAICAGMTAMVLFRTVVEVERQRDGAATWHVLAGAATGALCYAFCHTAWFSAVESEVYSLAMLLCSFTVWTALRWRRLGDRRRLWLAALLLGMGVCVHLMTLLAAPAVLLAMASRRPKHSLPPRIDKPVATAAIALMLFVVGLSPYAAVPLMARANPPVNEGNPATVGALRRYLAREQYEKAPLYPRMWRNREGDREREAEWSGGGNGLWANTRYCVSYQLGYMYGRYLLDNYFGRRRDDNSLRLYLLPLLVAAWGLLAGRRGMGWWPTTAGVLFLFGGPLLNLYLNHPCYEPRERDYAYVLSFYAVAIWIGTGATDLLLRTRRWRAAPRTATAALLLAMPLLMAAANWQDHDRHNRHAVHDIALNHLQSCDYGAILFTYGDNDTFPLWELHYAEGLRPDMQIFNINLMGYHAFADTLRGNVSGRPVYFTQYARDRLEPLFRGRLQLEGYCWRLMPGPCPTVGVEAFGRHIEQGMVWHNYSGEWQDNVTRSMLDIYRTNLALYSEAVQGNQ